MDENITIREDEKLSMQLMESFDNPSDEDLALLDVDGCAQTCKDLMDMEMALRHDDQLVDAKEMLADEKRAFKSYLQTDFLQYCIEQGLVTIPDEFYAVSDYSVKFGWDATYKDAREAGFVYDPFSDLEWSVDGSITKSADINAFVASLVYQTDDQWADDLEYELVKRKYDILVSAFESAGIDIKRIGNTTFK